MTRAAGRRRAMQQASKVGRIWLPVQGMAGLDDNGTNAISLSQGTPIIDPATGTIELGIMPMTTADEIMTILPIPWDMDISKAMAARVAFIHASTDGGDAPVWKVTYKFFGRAAETVETFAAPEETVSITSDGTSTTDNSLEITDWTKLNTDSYLTKIDYFMALGLELDNLGSATADECELVGVELAYQRNPALQSFKSIEAFIRENPV